MKKKIILLLLVSFYLFCNTAVAVSLEDQAPVIYLTFDDAPGDKVTEGILKTLSEEKVKATFFIVGKRIQGREDILKDIVAGGHSLGLHSYSHEMKKIYASPKVFIEEMEKTSEEIYKITGIKSNIIRFPGGSKPFMNKELLEKLHEDSFKIYDWNVPVSDGINAKLSPERFYKEATNRRKFITPLYVLMHCSGDNKNTEVALPSIIKFYKEKGYNFKAITEDTPEYYFKVKKTK